MTLAALTLAVLVPALAGCGGRDGEVAHDSTTAVRQIVDAVTAGLPSTRLSAVGTLPHAADARTEGMEVYDGSLYESATVSGRPELRELDLRTGRLIRAAPMAPGLEAGGVTVIGSLVWQLSRGGGVALQWNRETFNAGGRVPWPGVGRGLCHDDLNLFSSDGSNRLRVVNRNGTDTERVLDVRLHGAPLTGLDELECLPGRILANVAGTDWIVSIDAVTGEVRSASDVSNLVPAELRGDPERAPNGIALIPGTDTLLITGRLWPTVVKVRFG